MHFTCAVFTNTTNPDELENLLTPMLEGNDDYFEFCPSNDPVTEEEAEQWGLVCQDGIWGYLENPNAQFDYWDVEGKPTLCAPGVMAQKIPYAFVTKEGVWETSENFRDLQAWARYWKAALARNPKAYVTFCDCHI